MAKLYFNYATMNAGKTTMLLQASYNYRESGMTTMLFVAGHYRKGDTGQISSRIGLEADAEMFREGDDLFARDDAGQIFVLLRRRAGIGDVDGGHVGVDQRRDRHAREGRTAEFLGQHDGRHRVHLGAAILNLRNPPFSAQANGTHDDRPALSRAFAAFASSANSSLPPAPMRSMPTCSRVRCSAR